MLLIPALLCACTRQVSTISGGTPRASKSQQSTIESPDQNANGQVQSNTQTENGAGPASHGNYETQQKDGAELRQGRYVPGIPGGKLLAVTVTSDPKTFNAWAADDSFSLELCNLLFRGLADIDHSTGDVIPDMAAEISCDPDKLSYRTRLRRGLRWSDGTEINAEDVAFTWNKIVARGYGNPALREAAIVDGKLPVCTVEDELTNKFITAKPFVSFKRVLATLKIAPKHAMESTINRNDGRSRFKELWAADKDTSQIVTSGPFTLSAFLPGQKVELARSSNFYMIDRNGCRLPYLDKISYTIVPTPGAVVLAFDNKEADLAQIRPRDESWLATQQEKQNFKLFNLGPASTSFFLVFNMNRRTSPKSHKPFVDPVRSAWFNDTNFRQAVNHAIDRELIVRDFFKKAGSCSFACEPVNSPFYNHALKPFPQNLKLSETLLARSGFVKRHDGRLYDSSGNRVRFTLSFVKASKLYDLCAHTIAGDLKQLGIGVELQYLEAAQVQEIANGLGAKNWEAQLFSVTSDPLDPNSSSNLFRSNGRLHIFDQRDPDLRGNIVVEDARPWELRLDHIYDEAAGEFDRNKRKSLYYEAQKLVYDEAPYIYLVAPNVIVAARNTLKNYTPTPLSQASLGLHNVEEIYIDQGKISLNKNSQDSTSSGKSTSDKTSPFNASPDNTGSSSTNPGKTNPVNGVPGNVGADRAKSGSSNSSKTNPVNGVPVNVSPDRAGSGKTIPSKAGPNKASTSNTNPSKPDSNKASSDNTTPGHAIPDNTNQSSTNPDNTNPGETPPDKTNPDKSVTDKTSPDNDSQDESNPDQMDPQENRQPR